MKIDAKRFALGMKIVLVGLRALCYSPPVKGTISPARAALDIHMAFKLKDTKLRADSQVRAGKVNLLCDRFPALEAAIKSRNNSDFRRAIGEIARAAKTDDKAISALSLIQAENLSAFLKFCAEVYVGVGPTQAQVTVTSADVDDLFDDDEAEETA